MTTRFSSDRGFTLIESMVALMVLSVGLLGMAGVLSAGLQKMSSSPKDVIAMQKANEAIESVFSARDSHVLTWAQIQNVRGASGADGGVFLDGPQPLYLAGNDGLVNTADDTQTVEQLTYPGPDQVLATGDDRTEVLTGYTREIRIRNVELSLRSITVTIAYMSATGPRGYTLTAYISNYS